MKNIFYIFVFSMAVMPLRAHADYDKPYIGELKEYEARFEDTFIHVARDYNLGFVEMRAANPGIDPWVPGEGTDLILPLQHLLPDAPREGIVINLPEMRLYVFHEEEGRAPDSFPLGIGREGLETPKGVTKIVRKIAGPTWYPTERMRKEDPELPRVVPPGAENPMGTHAMYLGWPQYAIHGTNRPFGIGRRVSSGCIRMYPEDIKKVYEMTKIGTKVTVVDQPVKVAWIDGDLYMEAHPEQEEALEMEETGSLPPRKLKDSEIDLILKVAGAEYDEIDWDDVYKAISERRGYPVKIANLFGEPDQEEADRIDLITAKADALKALFRIYKAQDEKNARQQQAILPVDYVTRHPRFNH